MGCIEDAQSTAQWLFVRDPPPWPVGECGSKLKEVGGARQMSEVRCGQRSGMFGSIHNETSASWLLVITPPCLVSSLYFTHSQPFPDTRCRLATLKYKVFQRLHRAIRKRSDSCALSISSAADRIDNSSHPTSHLRRDKYAVTDHNYLT